MFKLNPVDGSFDHSTRFALVDRKSQIRGFYLTSEPDAIKRVIAGQGSIERAVLMDVHELPAVNAILNGTASILFVRGYFLIRAGKRQQHKKTMIAAFTVSVVFLISYLIYHANSGIVYYQKPDSFDTSTSPFCIPTRRWPLRCPCWRSSRYAARSRQRRPATSPDTGASPAGRCPLAVRERNGRTSLFDAVLA
jgi:hypothetical protein